MPHEPDLVMQRLGRALEHVGRGEREHARTVLVSLWAEVGPGGDPFHRCAVAHTLADLQDDPAEELRWDELALEAAGHLTEAHLRSMGVAGSPRGFAPSLHLNLADVHRRLGHAERARVHVREARATLDALADDGYHEMIRTALDRVEAQLAA